MTIENVPIDYLLNLERQYQVHLNLSLALEPESTEFHREVYYLDIITSRTACRYPLLYPKIDPGLFKYYIEALVKYHAEVKVKLKAPT